MGPNRPRLNACSVIPTGAPWFFLARSFLRAASHSGRTVASSPRHHGSMGPDRPVPCPLTLNRPSDQLSPRTTPATLSHDRWLTTPLEQGHAVLLVNSLPTPRPGFRAASPPLAS